MLPSRRCRELEAWQQTPHSSIAFAAPGRRIRGPASSASGTAVGDRPLRDHGPVDYRQRTRTRTQVRARRSTDRAGVRPLRSRLCSAQLFAAPKGVVAPHLSLEPDGDPVASWLDDVNKFSHRDRISQRRVTASHPSSTCTRAEPARRLHQRLRGRHHLRHFSSLSKNTSELRYMTSQDGGLFTHPRGIGLTGSESPGATVLAGGHRRLLAFWGCSGLETVCKEQGKIGTVSGVFSRSFTPLEAPRELSTLAGAR